MKTSWPGPGGGVVAWSPKQVGAGGGFAPAAEICDSHMPSAPTMTRVTALLILFLAGFTAFPLVVPIGMKRTFPPYPLPDPVPSTSTVSRGPRRGLRLRAYFPCVREAGLQAHSQARRKG